MKKALQNKRILIVGGSSGIGLAVAQRAAQLGGSIIVASRQAADQYDRLAEIVGRDLTAYSCDVTSEEQIKLLIDTVGAIDHLVITVRPQIKPAAFLETDIDEAKQAFESKFWGPYRLIQLIYSYIDKNGSITLTSGIAGEKIYKGSSTMSIINGAVETLCRSLAVELAPVRINAVSPGFVEPKTDAVQAYARVFPQPRLAAMPEVAEAFIYLMANDYLTGNSMVVDGGARLI